MEIDKNSSLDIEHVLELNRLACEDIFQIEIENAIKAFITSIDLGGGEEPHSNDTRYKFC